MKSTKAKAEINVQLNGWFALFVLSVIGTLTAWLWGTESLAGGFTIAGGIFAMLYATQLGNRRSR